VHLSDFIRMYPHLNARSGTVIATKIRTRAVGTFSTTSQTFDSAHGDDGGSRPFSSCFHKFLGFIIHDFHVAFALNRSFPTPTAPTLAQNLPLSNPTYLASSIYCGNDAFFLLLFKMPPVGAPDTVDSFC